MATRMQQRRGTAAQWTAANPTLAAGEIGFETDTSKFKIGNGSSAWTALTYFANAAELAAIIDSAPAALNTLNELAAAINDDANFYTNILTSIDNAVTGHNNASLNVHGIANTANLATTSYVSSAIADVTADYSQLAGTGLTWNDAADQLEVSNLIATAANLTNHASDTTSIHGIADTSLLATTSDISTHNSDTTDVHGIANTANLATTSDISTHNSDTTDVHGIADTAALATKSYADTAEADAITAAGTAADTKIATAVAALTKSSVGLANVDNTADTAKPVSTAQQTALDLKANLASPTFTGTVSAADLTLSGDLTVNGTTTNLNSTNLVIEDKNIVLGDTTTPTDVTADGGGITLKGATDKTFNWVDATDSWTSSEHINLASGKDLKVNGTAVISSTAGGFIFTDGTQTMEGVPSRTPIIQKTASYTLSSLTERDNLIEMSSASAITLSIPTDATLNYPIGTSIDILQTGAGQVTIAAVTPGTTTVNSTPGLKLRTTWSSCTLFKRAANTWVVYGDLTA